MTPRVSVVVSSYQRPGPLGRLLEALAAQRLESDAYEVIAVDNGSGPETAQTLEAALGRLDLDLRIVRHEQTRGPAGGRNSGWRLARAPLVAFTDDDCRPDPEWLAQLLVTADALASGPAAIIQGTTLPEPADLAQLGHTLFSRIVSVQAADGRYETCNILYPRELLTRLGGFDEGFLPHGIVARPVGEDTELGWRARRQGARTVFAPGAIVYHDVLDLGPAGKLALGTRWGGAVHLFKVHPEAREILFRRVFWNVWHYMGLRVLISLTGPAWLRRLLVGRYLRAMGQRARESGVGSWAVPYLIALDATEAAVLIRASIRERTLLL